MKTFCKLTAQSPAASYVPLPRFLLQDEALRDISNDAKVLYALLLDRASISRQNGYLRQGGENMNKNLIPMNERTKEEQREIARKGGRESGKVRRRKRTMKDAAQLILQLPVSAEQVALLQKYGVAESDCTNLMLIIAKAVQMAADGNLKAAEFIRDTLGENPQYKIYEKRLEYLIADKEAAHTLADEWVASIPDWEE